MILKKPLAFILSFLLILPFAGCSNTKKQNGTNFFSDQTHYHVGIETENVKTRGKIFFDESGCLHLLHEDPTSPLFGMEEVFSETCRKSLFHELEFETAPNFDGIGRIFPALRIAKETEPIQIIREKECTRWLFQAENGKIEFELLTRQGKIIQMIGTVNEEAFLLNFADDA